MKFQNVLISGPAYAQIASDSEETNVYKNDGDMYIQTDNEEAMYCVTEYLNLYNSNTSFSSQQWALLGTVSCKTLFAFSDQTSLILITAIVITLLVGIGGSIVISQMISKPVMSLAKSMNQADSSKSVTLPE